MATLAETIDALVAVDPTELDNEALGQLLVEASRQRDRLEAVLARAIAVQDKRAAWRSDGARSQKQWLSERLGLSRGQAAATATRARRLADLPETTAALAEGTVSSSQARVAADSARDLPADARPGLDQMVAQDAGESDPATLRKRADAYAHETVPESLAARERRAFERRRLTTTRTADGGVAVDGRLCQEGGEALLTALGSLAAPSGADDDRTAEQRQADALADLARRQLDAGTLPVTGGVRPHVTVTVSLETLRGEAGAPPAMLDRTGAISAETARMLACDSGVCRVLVTGASMPIDVGRQTRTATIAQRRALAVRDGGCRGCGAPAGWCDAHHIIFWDDGGTTDLANLVLLCRSCHRGVHLDGWKVVRDAEGAYFVERPNRSHPQPPVEPPLPARPDGAPRAPSRRKEQYGAAGQPLASAALEDPVPIQASEDRVPYRLARGPDCKPPPQRRPGIPEGTRCRPRHRDPCRSEARACRREPDVDLGIVIHAGAKPAYAEAAAPARREWADAYDPVPDSPPPGRCPMSSPVCAPSTLILSATLIEDPRA